MILNVDVGDSVADEVDILSEDGVINEATILAVAAVFPLLVHDGGVYGDGSEQLDNKLSSKRT